jgi:hypothetical protein
MIHTLMAEKILHSLITAAAVLREKRRCAPSIAVKQGRASRIDL